MEDIDITLNFFCQYGGGASWHVEDKDIKLLAALGIGLSIDWYHIEDESSYPDDMRLLQKYLLLKQSNNYVRTLWLFFPPPTPYNYTCDAYQNYRWPKLYKLLRSEKGRPSTSFSSK